jgi:hypothetical protein
VLTSKFAKAIGGLFMKIIVQILIASVLCTAVSGVAAAAARKCSITGTWTDKFGAEATFPTNLTGLATDTNLCPKPYRLTVTELNAKRFDLAGSSRRESCPAFTASLIFQGSKCLVAAGTVAVTGKGRYHDIWTKSDAAVRHAPAAPAVLLDGLK